MNYSTPKNKIIEEINLIPEDKLIELYDLIHGFRLTLKLSENNVNEIMKFAGCWQDLSEEEFTDFSQEIEQRRQNSSIHLK
ncbi:MAG TPA: hypothetical protein DCQ63_01670 [Planktothrix sp. UBA8402]|nr:hypothetical protein [Planktothrix sp. UBA8402]